MEEEIERHKEQDRAAWKARIEAQHAQWHGADDRNSGVVATATASANAAALPEGMEMVPPPAEFGVDEAFDPATGRVYYYRESTGETAWTRDELVSSWTDTHGKAVVRSMTQQSGYLAQQRRRSPHERLRSAAARGVGCTCGALRAMRRAPATAVHGVRHGARRVLDARDTVRADPWLLPRLALHLSQRGAHALALRAHKLAVPLPPLDSATVGLLGWDEDEAHDTLVDHQTERGGQPAPGGGVLNAAAAAAAATQQQEQQHELQHELDEAEAAAGVVVKKGRRHGSCAKGLRVLLHALVHPFRLLCHRFSECVCHSCRKRARERAAEARRLTPPAYRGPPVIRVLERHQLRQLLRRFSAAVHHEERREAARKSRRAARQHEGSRSGGGRAEDSRERGGEAARRASDAQGGSLSAQPTSQALLEEGGDVAMSVRPDGSILVSRPPPPSKDCTHADGSSRHRFREAAEAEAVAEAMRHAATPKITAGRLFAELLESQHSVITCAVFDLAGVDLSGGSGGANSEGRRRRMNQQAESPVDFCAFARVVLTLALMTDDDMLRFAFLVMDPEKRAGVPKDELREFVHMLHPAPAAAPLSKKAAKKAAKKHKLEHHKAISHDMPTAFVVPAPQAHKRVKRSQMLNNLLEKVPENWLNFKDVANINRRCPQLLFPLYRMQRAAMAIGPGTGWWRKRKVEMARQQARGAVMRSAEAHRVEVGELTAWQIHMSNHRFLTQKSYIEEAEAADARAGIGSFY